MSTTIDERVVEMRFDNKDFERNASKSMNTIEQLKKSLDFSNSAQSLDSLEKSLNRFSLDDISDAVDNISEKFSTFGIIAVTALENITNRAVDAGISLVKSLTIDQVASGWQKYADKTSAVQTIMAATGASMETVNEQLEKLNWYTDETSYNFVDMVSNIGKFTSAGIPLEEAVTVMMGIANWAAISGQNAGAASHAMYQLSQAMGAGVIKLMDWRSIEGTNMSTVEFKETALKAAAALKLLNEESEGVYKTLKGKTVTAEKGFNESLQEGWFTAEVFTKALDEYGGIIDTIYEKTGQGDRLTSQVLKEMGDEADTLGMKAFKAAQEAKTFADAIGSIKDAVSSQWSDTFEIIFGDYEKAKVTWTNLANDLWEIFASGGESRNDRLTELTVSKWDEVTAEIEKAGVSTSDLEDSIYNLAKTMNLPIDTWIDQYGSLEATFENGWFTANKFKDTLRSLIGDQDAYGKEAKSTALTLTEVQEIVSDIWHGKYGMEQSQISETLKSMGFEYSQFRSLITKYDQGIAITEDDIGGLFGTVKDILEGNIKLTEENIAALEKLIGDLDKSDSKISELFREAYKQNALDSMLTGIGSILKTIGVAVNNAREGFNSIFGNPDSAKNIAILAYNFEMATERMFNFVEESSTVQEIVAALAFPFKILWEIFKGLLGLLGPLSKLIGAIVKPLASLLSYLGRSAIAFKEATNNFKPLSDLMKAFVNVVDAATDAFINFIKELINSFKGPALEKFKNWISSIKESIKDLDIHPIQKLTELANKIRAYDFSGITEKLVNGLSKMKPLLKSAVTLISSFALTAKNAAIGKLSEWFSSIKESISKLDVHPVQKLTELLTKVKSYDFSTISAKLSNSLTKIKTLIKGIVPEIKTFFSEFSSNHPKISKWIDEIQEKIEKLKELISNFGKGSEKGFFNVTDIFQSIKEKGSDALDKIREKLESANTIGEKFNTVLSWISEKLQPIKDWASEKWAGIENPFEGMFDTSSLKGTWLGEKWDSMTGFFSGLFKDFDIGSIVKGGTIALLAAQLLGLIKAAKDLATSKEGLGEKIGEFIDKLVSPLKKTAKEAKNFDFLKFSAAVALLVGCMIAVSVISTKYDIKSAAEVMGTAIVALVGSFVTITKLAGKKTSNNALKLGVGILAFCTALILVCTSLKQLYKMFSGELNVKAMILSVTTLGILIGALIGVSAVLGSFKFKGTGSAGIGLIGFATSLIIIVQVIKKLYKMFSDDNLNPNAMASAFIGLGVIMLALTIVGNSLNSSSFKLGNGLGFITFVTSILLAVQIIKKLYKMFADDNLNQDAMISAFIGLGAIMAALVVVGNYMNGVKLNLGTGLAFIGLTTSLVIVVSAIKALYNVLNEEGFNLLAFASSLTVLALVMFALAGALKVMTKNAPTFGQSLGVVISLGGIIGALIIFVELAIVLSEMLDWNLVGSMGILGTLMLVLTVCVRVMSQMTDVKGALAVVISLAGLMGSLWALTALAKQVSEMGDGAWKSFALLMGSAIVAALIVVAFGKLIKPNQVFGAIAGCVALALFGVALIPLVNRFKELCSIDTSNMKEQLEGFGILLGAMAVVVAAFSVPGLQEALIIGATLAAAALAELGLGLIPIVNRTKEISELDPESTKAGIESVKSVLGIYSDIATKLAENPELFVSGLGACASLLAFGEALKPVVERTKEISELNPESFSEKLEAVNGLIEVYNTVTDTMQESGSERFNAAKEAATALRKFGKQLEFIIEDVQTLSSVNGTAALISLIPVNGIINKMLELARKFQNDSELFTAAESAAEACATFGEALSPIIADLNDISQTDAQKALDGLTPIDAVNTMLIDLATKFGSDSTLFTNAMDVSEACSEFAGTLKDMTKAEKRIAKTDADQTLAGLTPVASIIDEFLRIVNAFTAEGVNVESAEKSISTFKSFGDSLAPFVGSISTIGGTPGVGNIGKVFKDIVDAFNSISGADDKTLTGFKDHMTELSKVAFGTIKTGLIKLADGIGALNENPFDDKSAEVLNYKSALEELTTIADVFVASSSGIIETMRTLGKDMVSKLVSGLRYGISDVRNTANNISNTAYSAANSYTSNFYTIGANMGQGLANGISSKAGAVRGAAHALAVIAEQETRHTLDINSPSKVAVKIGQSWDEGLALGIAKDSGDVTNSSSKVATQIADFAMAAVDSINAIIERGDMNPVITPVLDLTNVRTNAGRIGGLLSYDSSAISLSSKISRTSGIIQNAKLNSTYGTPAAATVAEVAPVSSPVIKTEVGVNFEGSLSQLGAILQPVITVETQRLGGSLVKG